MGDDASGGLAVTLLAELPDPWRTTPPTPAPSHRMSSATAVLLGALATVARLAVMSPPVQRTAVWLAVAAVIWELLLVALPAHRRVVPCAMAAVATATVAITVGAAGRAPALVLLASVTVAHAALIDWSPLRGWPPRGVQVALLAVPPLVVAQVSWWRSGSNRTVVVLLAASLLVVEWYHRRADAAERADEWFRRAVGRLADGVGAVVLFVLAVPFVYLPGALVRLLGLGPFGRRARGRPASWTAASPDPVDDATQPFASPPASTRRRRHGGAAAVVVSAVVVVALGLQLRGVLGGPSGSAAVAPNGDDRPGAAQLDLLDRVPYSDRPAYAGTPWADQLQRDQLALKLQPNPRTGYSNGDVRSRWVNVEGGDRRSLLPDCAGCPVRRVWVVGASTVFGIGQRDDHTIPSELVRLAAQRGVAVQVRNLGVVGWTSYQEVTDLLHRLESGETPPDAVLFVDGFNDVMAAATRQLLGRGSDASPLQFDADASARALRVTTPMTPAQVDAAADQAARAYRSAHRRAADYLDRAGIAHLSVFQPDAFASPRQLDAVRSVYTVLPGVVSRAELGTVLDRTVRQLGDSVVNARDEFDGATQPVFLDVVHTNESGARQLAGRVFAALLRERWLTVRRP
ncbi:MAG: hypothetical protein ACKOYM_08800 [Actinomycetes bacterium]